MQRRFDPVELEWMDRPQPVTRELIDDLRNLRRLNRWFGSYGLIIRFLQRWVRPGTHLRLLDLATGSGDIPRLVIDSARKIGAKITIDAIDQQASTLEIARSLSADYPEISFKQNDILSLGSEDQYDIVLCSLVLHHFAEEEAVRVLKRCRQLSKGFVLVSDLRRSWLTSMGVYLLTALIFREPMTRNDARLSAARAFSFDELRSLAERAGWEKFGHRRFRYGRQAILIEPGKGGVKSLT
jgi:2-polyprenyl-3-methyl-5-hydroxy-6-metoxy-1,4-benzoquinol methylase